MNKTVIYISLLMASNTAIAENQILVLSGGDSPGLNNYSQYLQTKTLYEYVSSKHDVANITLFFGMGNNPQTPDPFPDVHQLRAESNNQKVDFMLPGIIANNQAATKQNILSYFLSPKIQNMNSNDNLVIFVSDHGLPQLFMSPKLNPYSDNCIDLWHFEKRLVNNFIDSDNFAQVCLSKNTLKALLDNIKAKHIVFEMSQCYSGGFHQMSVTLQNGYPHANPKICGFTAATDDHYASGCTSDANGPHYQGYERSFTEWYSGRNIPDGRVIHTPATNLWNAHRAAVLEDMTADTPLATSDYYLLKWADTINSSDFKSRLAKYNAQKIKMIFSNYQNYLANTHSQELLAFIQQTTSFDNKVVKDYPDYKAFFSLSLNNQESYIKQQEQAIAEIEQEYQSQSQAAMNSYLYLILPQWSQAVKSHSVIALNEAQYKIEEELYLTVANKSNNLLNFDNYWSMLNSISLQYLALNNNDSNITTYQKTEIT